MAKSEEPITIPDGFTGVAVEVFEGGKVKGRWFIAAHHPIARRLTNDLRVKWETSITFKAPKKRMAKAGARKASE